MSGRRKKEKMRMRFQNTQGRFAAASGCLAALGLLAVASAAPAQTVGVNFTGITFNQTNALDAGETPPDTDGAVGPTQIAEFINGGYRIFNKSGGAVSNLVTDTTFWNNAGISSSLTNAGVGDTRIIYDPSSSRWFASELTLAAAGNKILLGVSNSSDLTQGWQSVSYTGANSISFADFDTLSLDTKGVYIGTNNFDPNGNLTSVLTSIPKADLLLAKPSLLHSRTFSLNPFIYGTTLQGALDTGAGTGAIFAVSATAFGQIQKFNVNSAGAAGATLSRVTTINVGDTFFPSEAGQPDGTNQIDTGDDRFSARPVKVGNNIVLAHCIGFGNNAAIRITVVDSATGALRSEQTISADGSDYFYPSLALNASGHLVIGYNKSGASGGQYISAYAQTGLLSSDGILTLTGADILLKAGTGNYHLIGGDGERWGDYSATVLDPSNPNSFWTFQEIPGLDGTWSTQITQIVTPAATPEPGRLALFGGSVLSGLIALRRKRRK